jgi:hypothetical protein
MRRILFPRSVLLRTEARHGTNVSTATLARCRLRLRYFAGEFVVWNSVSPEIGTYRQIDIIARLPLIDVVRRRGARNG